MLFCQVNRGVCQNKADLKLGTSAMVVAQPKWLVIALEYPHALMMQNKGPPRQPSRFLIGWRIPLNINAIYVNLFAQLSSIALKITLTSL